MKQRTPMSRGAGFKRPVFVRMPPSSPAPSTRRATYACLEPEIPASIPKQPRAENKHLLGMARGQYCLIRSPICCGGTETTVACHGAGVRNGKGLGYKVGDHLTAAGCHRCNHYTDAYGLATAEEKEAAFMLGHLRQVEVWRGHRRRPQSAGQGPRGRAVGAGSAQCHARGAGEPALTPLCHRCELLFDECRPLAGERCGLLGGRAPVIRAGTLATRRPGAAVVLDHCTQEAVITPIVVVNFRDEP